jgi:hypothetical protein
MNNKEKAQPDSLTTRLNFYQSADNDNKTIKDNFVIRLAEFELIIDDIRNKGKGDPLQHELILGGRGSGKSTLLRRIQVEIDEDPELSAGFIAINLAEEQAGIYRLFDLWIEILKELSIKLGLVSSLKEYSSFPDAHSYTDYLYDEIHAILTRYNKKVVLLLDNIDRILDNFQEEGNLLRATLLNYDDLQVIGGCTQMSEHFWRYDKPFYEFFRRHHLEALSMEETYRLMAHWSEVMNQPQLKALIRNTPGKIETVRILTDGLPGTWQSFIQVLLLDSTLYGFDYIRKVMDKITPLYQEKINHLPAPQRKIVLEMAFLWEACSVKQLAEKCSMESKLVSAQLQKLSRAGIVETIDTSKKNHLYRVSDRFFNMWLIMTQGGSNLKQKAKWLSLFLETWYDVAKMPYDSAVVPTKSFELNEPDFQYGHLPSPPPGNQIIGEIWKGIFENLDEKALQVIQQSQYENLTFFIKELLVQEQTRLVLKMFEDPAHGDILQGKYSLLYYAALLLANDKSIDNIDLRIPPEVMPTVLEIMEVVKRKRSLYSKS